MREALVAANFGVSFEADVVVLMLTVPDLMVSLLMGGAMGAVLIPAFTQSPAVARILLYQAMLVFALTFGVLAAVLIWQAEALVSLLVPGFDTAQVLQVADALKFVLWLIPLTVLAGATTAYLHSKNQFIIASLGTLFVNVSIITGLYLVFVDQVSIQSLALFVILGGLLRLVSQVVYVRPVIHPIRYLRPLLLHRTMFIKYCQAMLSGSLLFLFPVVARAFASFEETGSVAVLNYSIRLIELPMAICISFLTVVLFPRLSQSFESDPELHRHYIRYGVQATLALSVVASIMLMLLAGEYASLVYGYGEMSKENIGQIKSLISIGLLVLPLQGLCVYNTAVFNSRTDTRTPMIINGCGLLIFLGLIQFDILGVGLEGIMWSLVASFGLILALQLLRLKIDQLKFSEIYLDRTFLTGIGCAITICIAIGFGIASLQVHLLLKLFLGFLAAIACLLVIALFYTEVRMAIRRTVGTDK
ncbi:MAG: lipid II flippase MurJ [bacterium]